MTVLTWGGALQPQLGEHRDPRAGLPPSLAAFITPESQSLWGRVGRDVSAFNLSRESLSKWKYPLPKKKGGRGEN